MMNARRHVCDYERLGQHSESLIAWAAITLVAGRLTRSKKNLTRSPITPPPGHKRPDQGFPGRRIETEGDRA